jgi:hypothetical protein
MARYIRDDRDELNRIRDDEAVDPRTGRRYRIEEIPEDSGFGWGLALGIFLMLMIFGVILKDVRLVPPANSQPSLGQK